jgi:GDP-4-dehydro-6-deoxy-D-mannose reductase
VHLVECDLTDAASVQRMIAQVQPDRVFHLAAQSFVPTSWHAPQETLNTNIISQLNLFEALRETSTRIQLAGSSEEYGLVLPDEVPIREENPLRPLSPYGVSKVAQDMLGYQYHQSYGMHIIRTRAFNHTGPRRGHVFVESNFARQGNCWRIKDVLDFLLSCSRVKVTVETDPARLRPSDVQVLQGSAERFHAATGWVPEIPLEKTFEDLLDYWRARV